MSDTSFPNNTFPTSSRSSPSAIPIRKRIRCDSDPQELDLTNTNAAGTSSGSTSRHPRDLKRNRPPHKMKISKKDYPRNTGFIALEEPDIEADTDPDTEMDPVTLNDLICSSASSNESAHLSMRQLEKRPAQALASSTDADVVKEASKVRHKRDDDYYFEDGSCVLLVGDTLFNVHRTMLSRDSSSFSTLFSLPQGTRMAEGGSDDNPIVLSGDSPEEFRDFMWALYALPPDLMVANSARANLGQLINVAHISNKYAFKSLEMWALDAIHDFVNRKPSPIFTTHLSAPASESGTPPMPPTQAETSHLLTQLIRLAQLCSHDRLMTSMISLLRQLMSSNVRYAYLAMTLSDELNLRALKGQAYMEVMRRGTVVRKVRGEGVCGPGSLGSQRNRSSSSLMHTTSVDDESEESEGGVDALGRLLVTRAQQLRLLAGYYRLTSLWDRLRLPPPSFEHSPSCGATWHQQGCTQAWLEFWKEKTRSDSVMSLGLADVLGRLRLVQKDFERWGSATYMHHDCRAGAKKAIVEIIATVEESLPDYFVEPGEFEED